MTILKTPRRSDIAGTNDRPKWEPRSFDLQALAKILVAPLKQQNGDQPSTKKDQAESPVFGPYDIGIALTFGSLVRSAQHEQLLGDTSVLIKQATYEARDRSLQQRT